MGWVCCGLGSRGWFGLVLWLAVLSCRVDVVGGGFALWVEVLVFLVVGAYLVCLVDGRCWLVDSIGCVVVCWL